MWNGCHETCSSAVIGGSWEIGWERHLQSYRRPGLFVKVNISVHPFSTQTTIYPHILSSLTMCVVMNVKCHALSTVFGFLLQHDVQKGHCQILKINSPPHSIFSISLYSEMWTWAGFTYQKMTPAVSWISPSCKVLFTSQEPEGKPNCSSLTSCRAMDAIIRPRLEHLCLHMNICIACMTGFGLWIHLQSGFGKYKKIKAKESSFVSYGVQRRQYIISTRTTETFSIWSK